MCLFSSIGYLKTVDRVLRAFVCFRQHLLQGGLVVVGHGSSPAYSILSGSAAMSATPMIFASHVRVG